MVKIAAVVDSDSLIGLERIGRLDQLSVQHKPIFDSLMVNREFGTQPARMKTKRLPDDHPRTQTAWARWALALPIPTWRPCAKS
jgi:hypothetical protein